MYSVVLMMAMTSGGDAPAGLFHNNSCCGGSCCGGVVYSGCCGGSSCHGSCHGGFLGGMFGGHKHHSCCGGGCCGGYAGCCGGSYAGCCGGGYAGCTGYGGCAGYGGCVGAPLMTPVPPTGEKIPVTPKEVKPKEPEEIAAPATLVVNVPADAVLTIDGSATRSTSSRRVFESPTLEPGREFHYTLKATYTRDGQPVVLSKTVTVKAGAEAVVDFNDAVASR
jgi:uncharacterized protein (TIGR03000 family)